MKFEDVIRERKSTRKFSNKEVPQEILDKILEAGRIAPTGKNTQPFMVYVIRSEEGLKKLDDATPCRYNSPLVLVVCGDKEKAYHKGDYNTYQIDASIVATHMMLEATNLGVDSIWIGLFDSDKIKEYYEIPDNLEVVCLLPLGYKDKLCPPSPFHKLRKKIDRLVVYK